MVEIGPYIGQYTAERWRKADSSGYQHSKGSEYAGKEGAENNHIHDEYPKKHARDEIQSRPCHRRHVEIRRSDSIVLERDKRSRV